MTDILKELYENYYVSAYAPTPECRDACRAEAALWDKLLSRLSEEELEDMQAKQSDAFLAANLDWFREGFRLGASLMLELL